MTVSGDPLGQFHHDHPPLKKHDHVVFHVANGARITFNDPRRLGNGPRQADALNDHWLIKPMVPNPWAMDLMRPIWSSPQRTRPLKRTS
jgi:formamidopyrimidine-DNA glycosylase